MTTSSSSSRTSMTREAAGELQPLLHSTSDSMIRKLVVANDTTIDMDAAQVEECDDTDSNKTEVEEIEMVDMEGRAEIVSEDEVTPLLAARHRLETRGRVIGNYGPDSGTVENSGNDGTADHHVNGDKEEGEEEEGKPGLDENGNPTSSTGPGPFPIMDPQLRPLSIYREKDSGARHTPVFRPQKLTVPSMSDREQMENRQATIVDHKLESRPQEGGKRKVRRKKGGEEGSVMKAEDIEGYRGKEDIDAILSFIEAEKGGKKKKSSEKAVDKSIGKKKIEEKEKVRRKKEKSVEKENNSTSMKTGIGKKLSVDNSSEAEILEEVEEEEEEEAQTPSLLEKVSLAEEERRDTLVKGSPASLGSCGRANSAPSNDSGHVSAEPYSLPSVSSTKEMSIASSPPLDLDPAEDLTAEDVILHSTEFTKVTKKQRRKRGAGARERNDRPHVYHQGSAFAEENRSRGEQQPRNGGQSENEDWGYRGYTRLRGSREAVTGAKSTCSVPPSDAP